MRCRDLRQGLANHELRGLLAQQVLEAGDGGDVAGVDFFRKPLGFCAMGGGEGGIAEFGLQGGAGRIHLDSSGTCLRRRQVGDFDIGNLIAFDPPRGKADGC